MSHYKITSEWEFPNFGPVNCGPETAELFSSSKSEDQDQARRLCLDCPARMACLAWSLSRHEYGIWGGTTEDDRAAIGRSIKRSHNPKALEVAAAGIDRRHDREEAARLRRETSHTWGSDDGPEDMRVQL